MKQRLADAIDELPERERLVLTLYYFEELTMKEIGLTLGCGGVPGVADPLDGGAAAADRAGGAAAGERGPARQGTGAGAGRGIQAARLKDSESWVRK